MKVSFHDYSLNIKGNSNPKIGSLVRFAFPMGFGYAVCHPWTEFGDAPLLHQKQQLREGKFTDLTRQSFYYAELDAKARNENRPLIIPETKLKSHFLVLDLYKNLDWQTIWEIGFKCLKIKVLGNDIRRLQEIKHVAPKLKWRLDFNSKSTYIEFCNFLEKIDLSYIDFIEDPFPFDENLWRKIEEDYGVSLAADFEKKHLKDWLPRVLVLKPAVDNMAMYKHKSARLIVTSYLSHPLDQVIAAFEASELNNGETMGLFTHPLFEKSAFSNCFGSQAETFFTHLGSGFGFGKILEELQWYD